jgi:hypothetical protein
MQPRLGVSRLNFIMADPAARLHKPAERSFDDPAFAQYLKATLILEAWHDLQP